HFVAWLSDSRTDAVDRIEGDGPWHTVNGEVAFHNRAGLAVAPIEGIATDPYGVRLESQSVWTGTAAGGRAADSLLLCADWTSNAWDYEGAAGLGSSIGWTEASTERCSYRLPLYCFEQRPDEAG
ncbi:MAG: hypothetical protein AAF721_30515, partial [Myxococcota bacterium]